MLTKLTARPAVRYLLVGGGTNLGLLGVYFGFTVLGIEELISSSLTFALGVLITYVLNKGWSFRDTSAHHTAFLKYILAYGTGYLLQISTLYFAVYTLNIPHIIGQLSGMMLAAVAIFAMLKLFVFTTRDNEE